jgi:hypothetical protein
MARAMNACIAAAQLPRAGRTEEARRLSRRSLADEPRQVAATALLSRLMVSDGDPHGAWALLNAAAIPTILASPRRSGYGSDAHADRVLGSDRPRKSSPRLRSPRSDKFLTPPATDHALADMTRIFCDGTATPMRVDMVRA